MQATQKKSEWEERGPGTPGGCGGEKETYMDYDTCVQFVMKQQSSLDLCNSLILQCQVKGGRGGRGGEGARFFSVLISAGQYYNPRRPRELS
jgi:hypothetical protein